MNSFIIAAVTQIGKGCCFEMKALEKKFVFSIRIRKAAPGGGIRVVL